MNETRSEQETIKSDKKLPVTTATSSEIQITQGEFSKLTYRQRFAVTGYSYLLSPEDAEEVGRMLGNMAPERDILSFCHANGKKVSSFETDEINKQTNALKHWSLIGLLASFIPGLYLFLGQNEFSISCLFGLGGFPGGMIGAAIGNAIGKHNILIVWVGAIVGACLGSYLWFILLGGVIA